MQKMIPQAKQATMEVFSLYPSQNNNDGEAAAPVKDNKVPGGWDDAPGSPQRVPLVTNNNGSPRLTNRIANIYGLGKQQADRGLVVASPHGSPRHRALSRLTNPAQEIVRRVMNLPPKPDLSDATSPKVSRKMSKEDANEIEEILSIPRIGMNSPKRNFYLNQGSNLSPGYHNPYQQANLVKSPLLPAGDTKFRFDHLGSKIDNQPASKPPLSPRRSVNSRECPTEDDIKTSSDFQPVNDNDRSDFRSDLRHKSRIPFKITRLLEGKFQRSHTPRLSEDDNGTKTETELKHHGDTDTDVDCNTNILINDVAEETEVTNVMKNSSNADSADCSGHHDCDSSREWNSTEFSITNGNSSSWNSDRSDCDQKMSIEDKNYLTSKISSVDSMRPRTNSCGSWAQSNASGEKSCNSASLSGSTGGMEMNSDTDSGMADSMSSKMVLIKCKGGTYLSRVFLNNGGQYDT